MGKWGRGSFESSVPRAFLPSPRHQSGLHHPWAPSSQRGLSGAPLPLQNPTRAQTHSQLGLPGEGTCLLLAGSSGLSLKLGSALKPSPQQPGSSAFLFPTPFLSPLPSGLGIYQISCPCLISHLPDSWRLFLVALPLSLTSLLPHACRQLTGIFPIVTMADPGQPLWPSEN